MSWCIKYFPFRINVFNTIRELLQNCLKPLSIGLKVLGGLQHLPLIGRESVRKMPTCRHFRG